MTLVSPVNLVQPWNYELLINWQHTTAYTTVNNVHTILVPIWLYRLPADERKEDRAGHTVACWPKVRPQNWKRAKKNVWIRRGFYFQILIYLRVVFLNLAPYTYLVHLIVYYFLNIMYKCCSSVSLSPINKDKWSFVWILIVLWLLFVFFNWSFGKVYKYWNENAEKSWW